jgi:hypothetical protein
MTKEKKIFVVCLLILLGAAMFCYGAFFNSANIFAPKDDEKVELSKSEPSLIKLASVGGVRRDEFGRIEQTFAEGEKPPSTCPT